MSETRTYKAEIEEDDFIIILADDDNDALSQYYELEEEHHSLLGLSELDEDYNEIRTIV